MRYKARQRGGDAALDQAEAMRRGRDDGRGWRGTTKGQGVGNHGHNLQK